MDAGFIEKGEERKLVVISAKIPLRKVFCAVLHVCSWIGMNTFRGYFKTNKKLVSNKEILYILGYFVLQGLVDKLEYLLLSSDVFFPCEVIIK